MVKLRATRRVALAALLAVPLWMVGCSKSSTSEGSGGDASLSSATFSVGALRPATFAPATLSYYLDLPYGTSTFTVTPTATDPSATITVTQDGGTAMTVASGTASSDLSAPAVGSRSILSVVVSAPGKATRSYGFLVTQLIGHDATLASLALSLGDLNPVFAASTLTYGVTLPAGTSTITVTPTANDSTATITIAQDSGTPVAIASGATSAPLPVPVAGTTSSVKVKVTAQDGTTALTYAITLSQLASNDATLASLADSAGGLTGFAPATLTYNYLVPFQSGAFTVTPTPTSALATVTVNGQAVANGQQSPAITLTPGSATAIAVVVTSQDHSTTKTYTLNVSEGPQAGLVTARTPPTGASALATVAAGATLPANGATGVPVDTLLRIGFDAAPTLGTTGTIKIYRASDSALVDTINIADPYAIYDGTSTIKKLTTNLTSTKLNVIGTTALDQVRLVNYVPILLSGNTVVIVPHNNKLAYNTQYYVNIDNGLLVGARSGSTFSGIADTTSWTFTTKAAAPTTLNVAADNSADFATVQGAIDAVASGATATVNIAAGVYQELLWIRKKNITLKGADNLTTIVQYDNCDGFNPGTGGGQALTSGALPAGNLGGGGRAVLLTSSANAVVLDSITLKNLHGQGSTTIPTLPTPTTITAGSTASPTYVNYSSAVTQAETLYFNVSYGAPTATTTPVEPGQLVAKHSNFISYQDTLQVKGWVWFYDCFITGDVDFIWGNVNAALFERSEIKSRYNTNGAAIVQSRAYLNYLPGVPIVAANPTAPSITTTSYPGFVFLNCALTKEAGDFTAYLARSPGAASTGTVGSGTAAAPTYVLFTQYDLVSFVNCSMDSHIGAAGWNVVGGNPTGANIVSTPVVGWREYHSFTPAGRWVDVSGRLANPSPASASQGGGLQLSDANVTRFFADRPTVFGGATDGTYTTTGYPSGWNPQP